MKRRSLYRWLLFTAILAIAPPICLIAEGGYFGRVEAVSADQRAIIIRLGDEISMTFSTGYTGDGEDFGWIIPTPIPPDPAAVAEAGEAGDEAFLKLDNYTAPGLYGLSGCFPAGTEILTAGGPRAIETVAQGDSLYAFDFVSMEWVSAEVSKQGTYLCEGDMVTIHLGQAAVVHQVMTE